MTAFPVPPHLALRKEPSQARTRRLLDKILDTTAVLIEEKGLSAVNTNLIAERADIDIASLYRFFKNKESIFFAVARRWYDKVQMSVEEAVVAEQAFSIVSFNRVIHHEVRALPDTYVLLVQMTELFSKDADFADLEAWHRERLEEIIEKVMRDSGCDWDTSKLHEGARYIYDFMRAFLVSELSKTASEHQRSFAWHELMMQQLDHIIHQDAPRNVALIA